MRKYTGKNLERLGSSVSATLPKDENGLIGRECPNLDCEGYFKVKSGTGLTGVDLPCHCPYCGETAPQNHFYTKEQIKYARSVALRKITDALHQDLKSLEFESKPTGLFGIGMSIRVKKASAPPIHSYREKQLETHLTCGSCSLEYAVYGVFAYCPDCGSHNSLQMFERNLDLVRKMVDLCQSVEKELHRLLLENAFEDCISAFDGFGRQLCIVNAGKSNDATKAVKVSFQNLVLADASLRDIFGFSLETMLDPVEWQEVVKSFQMRHLIAHKMGVIDQEYIKKSGDATAKVGRKIDLDVASVRQLIQILLVLGKQLADQLGKSSQGP